MSYWILIIVAVLTATTLAVFLVTNGKGEFLMSNQDNQQSPTTTKQGLSFTQFFETARGVIVAVSMIVSIVVIIVSLLLKSSIYRKIDGLELSLLEHLQNLNTRVTELEKKARLPLATGEKTHDQILQRKNELFRKLRDEDLAIGKLDTQDWTVNVLFRGQPKKLMLQSNAQAWVYHADGHFSAMLARDLRTHRMMKTIPIAVRTTALASSTPVSEFYVLTQSFN